MSHSNQHKNRANHGNFPNANRAGDKITYNVLKCRPVINSTSPQVAHDHLQVLVQIESGQRYWMTINIRNGQDNVSYYASDDYQHAITQTILDQQLPEGFTALDSKPGGISLDYIREQLFDFVDLVDLQHAADATQTDLSEILTTEITNAYRFQDARLFIFGSRFDDGERYSSYGLPTGIHDIHMNQGSKPPHAGSNGIYQDGGLLVFYPTQKKWSAVFMKFETQSDSTDNAGN